MSVYYSAGILFFWVGGIGQVERSSVNRLNEFNGFNGVAAVTLYTTVFILFHLFLTTINLQTANQQNNESLIPAFFSPKKWHFEWFLSRLIGMVFLYFLQ